MADTGVDTTSSTEVPATKDLKEKKEVVEEPEKAKNGGGDAPANGTEENGADHSKEKTEDPEEEDDDDEAEGEGEGEGDEEEEEGEGEETEKDGHPVKRAAEDEKEKETKKQKTENGDSTEVKESA
ncbi:prothymosin alpha-like isoform X1 [Eleutherodactylus coqui]|uniref:prothymosin alpha-like isoform X1 n=1 Tax=Eleutherodactylus coqui TaxID=57060 RepID=UPI003462AFBB